MVITLTKKLALMSIITLASCTKGINTPSESLPDILPSKWNEASDKYIGEISSGWIKEFNSSTLNKLINETLSNNHDLRTTETQLRQLWHTSSVASADLKPTVNFSTSGSRSRAGLSNTYSTSLSKSISTSWEPDFWGQIKDEIQVEKTRYLISSEALRNARLSLVAQTSIAWFNLITAEQRLELATNTLSSFEKNKSIVERNYKAGIIGTSALAVQLSKSNVASAQSTLEQRILIRDNAVRRLELLLGRYPANELRSNKNLPLLKSKIPASLPVTLLERRPDIINAKRNVYISAKQADISRKNLLPNIRFSSNISRTSNNFESLFNWNSLVLSVAGNLSQNIFDGGLRRADAKAALENNKAQIHAYVQTVLDAAGEIENALASDQSLAEQERFLILQNKSSSLAQTQAERDFSEGIDGVGILEVLETQRRANNARVSLIELRNDRLQNRVNLHLALGGDYYTTVK